MKKEWKQPIAVVEQFEPSEYIASCYDSDSGNVFTAYCDARAIFGESLYLIEETTGDGVLQGNAENHDTVLGTMVSSCTYSETFTSTDSFRKGYVVENSNIHGSSDNFVIDDLDKVREVFIWDGADNDTHAFMASGSASGWAFNMS